MATLNEDGNVTARCPGCEGALASFFWTSMDRGPFGAVTKLEPLTPSMTRWAIDYRVFKCGGCGAGALGVVRYFNPRAEANYPGFQHRRLLQFFPHSTERLKIPDAVPKGIRYEFREAEACMEARCHRAAAGLFRSVLDKTLRSNGYKLKPGTTLQQQIDLAADDGIITPARQRRAHDEIRVLGNDVLHDDWQEISEADVEAARHYAQRILEDFYDDRETVLKVLRAAGRTPEEDQPNARGSTAAAPGIAKVPR